MASDRHLDDHGEELIRHECNLLMQMFSGVASGEIPIERAEAHMQSHADAMVNLFRAVTDRLRQAETERAKLVEMNSRLLDTCEKLNAQINRLN